MTHSPKTDKPVVYGALTVSVGVTPEADHTGAANRYVLALGPFVIGRKGWLFSDTPAGAHASAVLYALLETAKANGRESYAWLHFVLERLPLAKTVDEMETLWPWNTHDQTLAMNLAASE